MDNQCKIGALLGSLMVGLGYSSIVHAIEFEFDSEPVSPVAVLILMVLVGGFGFYLVMSRINKAKHERNLQDMMDELDKK